MTTWFDTQASLLHDLSLGRKCHEGGQDCAGRHPNDDTCQAQADALGAFEEYVVRTLTLAVELPGFPEDLRDTLHRLVLQYGVTTVPDTVPPVDFEYNRQYVARLGSLLDATHLLFHDLSRRDVEFGDDPENGLRNLYSAGDARRAAIYAASGGPLRARRTAKNFGTVAKEEEP